MPNSGLIWFCDNIPPRLSVREALGDRDALYRQFLKVTSFQSERLDKDSIIEVLRSNRDDIKVNSCRSVIYKNITTYLDRHLRQI